MCLLMENINFNTLTCSNIGWKAYLWGSCQLHISCYSPWCYFFFNYTTSRAHFSTDSSFYCFLSKDRTLEGTKVLLSIKCMYVTIKCFINTDVLLWFTIYKVLRRPKSLKNKMAASQLLAKYRPNPTCFKDTMSIKT